MRSALKIGVVKEIKPDEYRVALTPAGARELVQRGHEVVVEARGRRRAARSTDGAYERAGARIVSVDEAWETAELLLKVKEPIEPEYGRLREGLVLFTYLHIAADEPLTRALVESGITAVAYETVETDDRRLPLLAPMSEIAGRLAAQAGAHYLEKPHGGRGLLLGGVAGVAPGRVVIVGGGIVGYNSAIIALGLGAQVTILERSIDRMRHLEEILSGRVSLLMSSSLQIEESLEGRRPRDRRRADPRRARAEADHARDDRRDEARARSSATSRSTRAAAPRPRTRRRTPIRSTTVDGVIHYCVANMPGAVPITSTKALTNATLPYVEAIADSGLRDAVAADRALAPRRERRRGRITYEAVAEAHELDYTPLEVVLPLSPV